MRLDNASPLSILRLLSADLIRFHGITRGVNGYPPSFFHLLVLCLSPRFLPVLLYRISHYLYQLHLIPLARIVSLVNFIINGIEISMRCSIGPGIFFPHTQGTVIGAWSVGSNVTIYQGVTIGAKDLDLVPTSTSRPIICNDVILGSGAKVLGGVIVGNNVIVGANSVVLSDLPPGALAVGSPARVKKFL